MISISLSTAQSILAFSAFCVGIGAIIVALFRMNIVRAAGVYKGARLSLEATNQGRKPKRRRPPKPPQLPKA